jgi:hypothetical protein
MAFSFDGICQYWHDNVIARGCRERERRLTGNLVLANLPLVELIFEQPSS